MPPEVFASKHFIFKCIKICSMLDKKIKLIPLFILFSLFCQMKSKLHLGV